MVYAVSHDIGEPMREIAGFAKLLASRAPEDADERFWQDLNHVEEGAHRARAMLEALCEYIQAEQTQPIVAQVDLSTLVIDAVASAQAQSTEHPSNITSQAHGVTITYPQLVTDVVAELAVNAARFARTNGDDVAQVSIGATAHDAGVTVTVTDNGPGLDQDSRARALQLFQRLHRRTELETIGAGLALLRRRIETCGGAIQLMAAATGGLTVQVDLPHPVIDLPQSATTPNRAFTTHTTPTHQAHLAS
jgi:light-regulated signal transduction histidine kinase (bacteriophytochrome)